MRSQDTIKSVGKIRYQDLSILVADDFSSFRATVNSMLLNLGIVDVDMASTGEEVIEKCGVKSFDVILCDYDLGPGRNGQHVLEQLRHNRLIAPTSIFIMVSAEASRNIVMSAYDCEPDDYLMKPVTGLMLQQRMHRLLAQKDTLRPVYNALKAGDLQIATDILIDLSIAEDRYSLAAQKMLGELFITKGELQKAEKLYTKALESRSIDWARLGLAKVKHLKGDLDTAGNFLERIVTDNPLYLPAYDVLADNWSKKGAGSEVQNAIERAIDVSPMSILRQKRLAKVADENEDAITAVDALRKTIKLGKLSCYGGPEDGLNLARTVSGALEKNLALPPGIEQEAIHVLEAVPEDFDLTQEEIGQIHLLKGRVYAGSGNAYLASECLQEAEEILGDVGEDIEVDIDRLELLLSMGQDEEADTLIETLKIKYGDDQEALKQLDKHLAEPASESNRELVAEVNREGIDLYGDKEYDRAIECFERARKLFPKHVGIQLNIVQSLIGKMSLDTSANEYQEECHSILLYVESLIDVDHAQYGRFLRLKKRAETYIQ